MSLNVQCLLARLPHSSALLALYAPSFVFIQETWLNRDCENIYLQGYDVIARRDRSESENRGRIITLCKSWLSSSVAHWFTSEKAERMWHVLMHHIGIVALCNWYRPPGSGDINSIEIFEADMIIYREQCIGMIMVGDINVHHIPWLTFSHSTTPEGIALESICSRHGLDQIVKKPRSGEYLFNLCATNLNNAVKTEVLASITDHKAVKTSFAVPRRKFK